MGQDIRQYWAITLRAMHGLMDILEEEWAASMEWVQKHNVGVGGSHSIIAFYGSF
jgi:hypothetical protein